MGVQSNDIKLIIIKFSLIIIHIMGTLMIKFLL